MTPAELLTSALAEAAPPPGLRAAVQALWWQAKGDWGRAHQAAQADEGREAAWVHALLHREEGDLANADYWYRRAGQRRPAGPLAAEWQAIAAALLT